MRDVLATKRIWTEWYAPRKYTDSGVATFLTNIETYWNTGVQLTVTHAVTGSSINCYLIEREIPEVVEGKFVLGLSLTFAEA